VFKGTFSTLKLYHAILKIKRTGCLPTDLDAHDRTAQVAVSDSFFVSASSPNFSWKQSSNYSEDLAFFYISYSNKPTPH